MLNAHWSSGPILSLCLCYPVHFMCDGLKTNNTFMTLIEKSQMEQKANIVNFLLPNQS